MKPLFRSGRRFGRRYLLALLLGLGLGGVAGAQPAGDALTLTEAVDRALVGNPELRAGALRRRAAGARVQQAAQMPPFIIGGELEDVAGTGPLSGASSGQATLTLSRVLELGGKRGARAAVAEGAWAVVGLEQEAKRLDLLAEVARHFVHVIADQGYLELTAEATELAERTVAIVADRVAAARAPVTEENRAAVALARARIAQEHAEHELQSSRLALAVLWGDVRPDFAHAAGDLFDLPDVPAFDALAGRLEANPDLARFATERRQTQARLRLAEAARRPDIRIGAGITHHEDLDAQALRFSVSVPLGTAKRAEPGIIETEAGLTQLEWDAEAKRLGLHAFLFDIYQELAHARTEVETLRAEVLPRVEETLRRTEQGFRAGRFSLLDLSLAQSELLAARRDILRASRDYHDYLIELERLTGSAVAQ